MRPSLVRALRSQLGRALGVAARCEMLAGLGPALEAASEELADLITREMGKPRREALGEVKVMPKGSRPNSKRSRKPSNPRAFRAKAAKRSSFACRTASSA